MIDLTRLKLVQSSGVSDHQLEKQGLIERAQHKYVLTEAGDIAAQLQRVGNVLTGAFVHDGQQHEAIIVGISLKPNVIAYYYWGADQQHEGVAASENEACHAILRALQTEDVVETE